jgi:two-component system, chemotaxis family, protein-glutamate methylesterase/glutaminase
MFPPCRNYSTEHRSLDMAKAQAIVVIGASEGGVRAMRSLAAGLLPDLDAALFVVLHIGAHKSQLPWLLNHQGPFQAVHAKNGQPIAPRMMYVAPPDHHLLVEPGYMRLAKGPRENWARPAIDPLFRSAAQAYGPDVIGVVLTGGLNDGSAGLYEVKRHGGTAVVQDPEEAANPSMPRSALEHVEVDHCVKLAQIPELLARLVAERGAPAPHDPAHPASAKTRGEEMTAEYRLEQPALLTCPDCGGALPCSELTPTLSRQAGEGALRCSPLPLGQERVRAGVYARQSGRPSKCRISSSCGLIAMPSCSPVGNRRMNHLL